MRPIHGLAALPALLAGCASESNLTFASPAEDADGYTSDTADARDTGGGAAEGDFADDEDTSPPETEDTPLLYKPAVTERWLFVVNPARDSLTRVEVDTLAVATVGVGAIPTTIAASSDGETAVILNEGDDTVSVVNGSDLAVTTVEVRDGMNRLSVSEAGPWAMAWYDPDWEASGTWEGVQSFNEVSFVHLDPGEPAPLVVGYLPHDVRWSADGTRAVVVADSMLSVVDLTVAPPTARHIPIAGSAEDAPAAEEVELSTDGRYAFVRQFGSSGLLAVDLDSEEVTALALEGTPTDMDVDPEGGALAVLVRTLHVVYRYAMDDPFAEPEVVSLATDGDYGSITFVGEAGMAVLSTNATLTASLAVWDSATGELVEKTLVKPVDSVGAVDGSGSALVFHTRENQSDIQDDSPFASRWALTMIDLETMQSTPLLLDGETRSWGATDDGHWAFVGLYDELRLEVLDLHTHLPDSVSLASQPLDVGALPGRPVGYASMEHELGRIGFYDAETGDMDTLTGFELNAEIEH